MIWIRETAIYRTHGSTLWFVMKTLAFRALVRHDIVEIRGDRFQGVSSIHHGAIFQRIRPCQGSAILHGPVHTAFIDGIIGTFRLTRAAIDTIVCDINGHMGNPPNWVWVTKVRDRKLSVKGDEGSKG
jgi:hypothetical protein